MKWEHLINLPDNINNPVAIFKSKTQANSSKIILTEIKNYKEKPLLVALHLNNDLEISKIASIYSKRSENIYKKWCDEGLCEYVNKKVSYQKGFSTAPIAVPLIIHFHKAKIRKKPKKTNKNQKKVV